MNIERKRHAMERYKEVTRHDVRRKISAVMLYALDHPVRRQALRVLHAAAGPISPREISIELLWDLQSTSYHVRVLRKTNLIELVDTHSVKGATEHFYVSKVGENDLLETVLKGTMPDDRIVFEE